jgi:TonB family protein
MVLFTATELVRKDLFPELARKLKPLKPSLVAVADFVSPDGSALAQAHYFAWLLSSSLQERGKKYLRVAEHIAFDTDIANILGAPSTPLTSQALHEAAPRVGADVVVIGTVVKRERSYVFEIISVRVSSGAILDTINTSVEVTGFLDSLLTPFPSKDSGPIFKAGVGDIGMPSCIHCPDPSYTDLGRAKKIQGTSVFEVVVSPDGQAHQLRPVKLLGSGLDEEAYNAIRKWKFKPATNKIGAPVSVLVPVEVTFRLF